MSSDSRPVPPPSTLVESRPAKGSNTDPAPACPRKLNCTRPGWVNWARLDAVVSWKNRSA